MCVIACVIACGAALGAAFGAAGCAYAAPRRTPESPPPPRVLVVSLEQVRLRTSAWVELHAWLSAAARGSPALGEPSAESPELQGAVRAYRSALEGDTRDERSWAATQALAPCVDERCARAALEGTELARPFIAALPVFLEKHWTARANVARGGIETARTAIGPELEPLVERLARDLAIDWPKEGVAVDVVAEAPDPGRDALVRPVIGARGACFAGAASESTRVHDARIMDCVLAYAALRAGERSLLARALASDLPREEQARAWMAVVVHAAAAVITAWEPKHASVLRRSAIRAMPEIMDWLAREWPSRMRGEPVASFAKRYGSVVVTAAAAAAAGTKER